MTILYRKLALVLQAYQNNVSKEWKLRHQETLDSLVKEHLPSGAGFDSGTRLLIDISHSEKLIFQTSFHHMNEQGFYTEWSDHNVTIVPSLAFGFSLKVSGKNKNNIKEYIAEAFDTALHAQVDKLNPIS